MGPPLSTWPLSHRGVPSGRSGAVLQSGHKWLPVHLGDKFKVLCYNFTFAYILLHVFFNLNSVMAGPVVLNLDYLQGPVPLARNIRHLPCISRRTGQEGLCMFAIDCLKANGTHLGTCIDRFYFGSCCQIPDKNILPQIIGNNIDDNTIDSSNFIHPQTEDKAHSTVSKIPSIFPSRKTTTEKTTETITDKSETMQDRTEPVSLETKTDDSIENDKNSDKKTTPIEATTKSQTKLQSTVTEAPIKLSTFQTISSDISNLVAEETKTTEAVKETQTVPTTPKPTKPPVSRKPTKPTYKPRPTFRPSTFTKPQILTTIKPRPTKPPLIFNITRKPPYKLPPKRNTTKKPLPSPPRLNITIIPQSTSTRPLFTRPSAASITYINTTLANVEKVTTTTTIQPLSSSTKAHTTIAITEPITETAETMTDTTSPSSTASITEKLIEKATVSEPLETQASEAPLQEQSSSETVPNISVTEVQFLETSSPDSLPTETSLSEITIADVPLTEKTTSQSEFASEPSGQIVTERPSEQSVLESASSESSIAQTSSMISPEPTFDTSSQTTLAKPSLPESPIGDNPSEPSSAIVPSVTEKLTTAAVAEKDTVKPVTEGSIPLSSTAAISTPFPPLVTWSTVDAATKAPENATAAPDENWSPITPPEGWVLISTIPPTKEPTVTTTQSTTTSTSTTTTASTTTTTSSTTTPSTTTTEPTTTTLSTTTSASATKNSTTTTTTTTEPPSTLTTEATETESTEKLEASSEPTTMSAVSSTTSQALPEFVVNVTLSPTVPTTTIAFTPNATSDNTTQVAANATESTSDTTNATVTAETTTAEPNYNMTNYKEVCGRRLWPQARIVGGQKSSFGQWPWQISLRQYRTSTYLHKCGAALLNENWAITAAHCVEHVPPSELLVRLGEHDLANDNEPYGFAERRVQIIASHPHFDPATFEYDLALLRFYEPVTFKPNILPVCVPDDDEDFVGKTAYVTGWGRLYDDGPLPSVLQEVRVPVINNSLCELMYQEAGYNEHIPNIFICAGRKKGGADSCEGDSGGPMVLQRERDNRFVLGGVISWGIGCAEPNQPGVYTRISEFRDWINQILQF